MVKNKNQRDRERLSQQRKTLNENYLSNNQKTYSVEHKKCCKNEQVEDKSVNGKIIKDSQEIL